VATCLGFAAVAFTNVSLFTTLLSVGVLLFLIMAPLIPCSGVLAAACLPEVRETRRHGTAAPRPRSS
jgi:hypothetical protein